MKKLFLASYAAVTLELVQPLLPKPDDQLKVAFIPTEQKNTFSGSKI